MKISFYEEFPAIDNLEKLRLVSFKTEIFVAAHNLYEFFTIRKAVKNIAKDVKVNYWPILDAKEGYWISPFCDRKALKRVIEDLKNDKGVIKIAWDSELPLRKSLLIKNIFFYFSNKRIITRFLKESQTHNKDVLITENPIFGTSIIGKILGLYFDPKVYHHRKTFMYYTSMIKSNLLKEVLLDRIIRLSDLIGGRLSIGLGAIATGVRGDEPILKPNELDRDLETMQQLGLNEVIIYRLGGLNKKYVKVVKKYVD